MMDDGKTIALHVSRTSITFNTTNTDNAVLRPLTRGMVGYARVQFSFGDGWDGLEKEVVFSDCVNDVKQDPTTENNETYYYIPLDVVAVVERTVKVGVRGLVLADNETHYTQVIPTVWFTLGKVLSSAPDAEQAYAEAYPSVIKDLQRQIDDLDESKADASDLDGKVSKSGDTMSGDLMIHGGDISVVGEGNAISVEDDSDTTDYVSIQPGSVEIGNENIDELGHRTTNHSLQLQAEHTDGKTRLYAEDNRGEQAQVAVPLTPEQDSDATSKKYVDDSVDGLASEEWVEGKGYLTSVPRATSSAYGGIKASIKLQSDTQEVHIGTDGKLYTAPGSGGTDDHRLLTNRDAANQHPVSAIAGSGNSSANARTGDLFMGGHAIHNVADANPANNLDAVNVQFMRGYVGTAVPLIVSASLTEDSSGGYQIEITDGTLFDTIVDAFNGTESTQRRPVFLHAGDVEIEAKQYFPLNNALMFAGNFGTSTLYATMLRRQDGSGRFPASATVSIYLETSISGSGSNKTYPTTKAVADYVSAVIGDTAGALTSLDNLIGGDPE